MDFGYGNGNWIKNIENITLNIYVWILMHKIIIISKKKWNQNKIKIFLIKYVLQKKNNNNKK